MPVPAELLPLLLAFTAYFAAVATAFLARGPVSKLKGAALAALAKLVRAPEPGKMIMDLTKAHQVQNKICKDKGLDPCTGPVGVKFFADGRPSEHVLINDIPQSDYCFILSLFYLFHFATNKDMWLEMGGGKTGRTFLSFATFLSPITRHILTLLGWAYCIVIVKDLAECHADPLASKEDGPTTNTYKFLPLVLASIAALFLVANGQPKWGVTMILGSQSLAPYLPKGFFRGLLLDAATLIPTGTSTYLHAGGRHTGVTKHLSLPHSPTEIFTFMHQAAMALSVAVGSLCVPILDALSNPDVIAATSEAMAQVDPRLLEAVRDPALRAALEEFILDKLGLAIGGVAFAALVTAASRHNITFMTMDQAAIEAAYEDRHGLVRAAVLGDLHARGVELNDGRRDEGGAETLGNIIEFIETGKYHPAARTILEGLREGSGSGSKRGRGRAGGGGPTAAMIKSLVLAIALHLECGYAGALWRCCLLSARAPP